jgi:hypothetical protein|nr:MAG TPA: hypothetical protein [Caudoviricetes sp.]
MIGQSKIKERERNIAGWKAAGYNTIKFPDPIGQLVHEPTMSRISVYKPISRFKRLMLRWCFGLKFEKI